MQAVTCRTLNLYKKQKIPQLRQMSLGGLLVLLSHLLISILPPLWSYCILFFHGWLREPMSMSDMASRRKLASMSPTAGRQRPASMVSPFIAHERLFLYGLIKP